MTSSKMEIDTVVVGDCLDVMAEMPDGCVDLVIADPPYNIGKFKNMPKQKYFAWCLEWTTELVRITKEIGSLCICFARQWFPELYLMLRDDLELFDRRILIYHFRNGGFIRPTSWRSTYEAILYFTKSDNYTFNVPLQWSDEYFDVHIIARPQTNFTDKRIHPTQKPLELICRLVRTLSNPSDLILDPFMGSGTTAVAALKLGRHFYGCDINPEYVKLANKRVAKARLEMAQMEMDL